MFTQADSSRQLYGQLVVAAVASLVASDAQVGEICVGRDATVVCGRLQPDARHSPSIFPLPAAPQSVQGSALAIAPVGLGPENEPTESELSSESGEFSPTKPRDGRDSPVAAVNTAITAWANDVNALTSQGRPRGSPATVSSQAKWASQLSRRRAYFRPRLPTSPRRAGHSPWLEKHHWPTALSPDSRQINATARLNMNLVVGSWELSCGKRPERRY